MFFHDFLRYDIAVLRLNRPVVYRENILPICLPDPSDDFIGDVGIVAGWGKTDNSFGEYTVYPLLYYTVLCG